MNDNKSRFARLSPEQRRVALKKLQKREPGSLSEKTLKTPPIQSVPRVGNLPLSFAQQRLWFLAELEPSNPVYNFPPIGVRLVGRLDVRVLLRALETVVQRHEALRTTFATADGCPIQVIRPMAQMTLPVVDLQDVKTDREIHVSQLVSTEARRPFDLQRGPLWRALLLKLGEDDHILLPFMHHIISDLWSFGLFIRELATLYEAFSTGAHRPLPELPIQYADYAMWQRQRLQGQVLEELVTYWKRQLEGAPEVLELQTDRCRPPVQTSKGAKYTFKLSRPLTDALKTLSQREGVTLFMTLLAAFKTLLYRYTGQPDIVVGSPIANRNRSEIETLIGFFANTLALRTNLRGDPSFRELLRRVREVTLGAYAHQDLPFEMLVDALQPERSLSYSPVFQIMFVLQNMQNVRTMLQEPLTLPELTLSAQEYDAGLARFDLTLSMIEIPQGLLAVFEYNTDLFDASTITRMAGHFRTLLEGIVADPEQRIADLPLLTSSERWEILTKWNDTAREHPEEQCIHEFVERQAERMPQAVAVVFEEEHLTYGELDRRANQLAHYLQARGIGPEARVGLYTERSLEMVVGLLGILKAGGAYVPLDPAYPKARVAFMVQDAQLSIILAQGKLADRLGKSNVSVVCLDSDWKAMARESAEKVVSGVTAENLAYAIYTSGSTGQPKGVQISHRAVLNLLNSMQREPGLTNGDTLLAVTSLSFDIAGLELYLPLVTGARLELASRTVASDGKQLREKLAASGVTVMQATPVTWRLLLAAGWVGDKAFKALCGGEALPRDLANQLLDKGVALWNLYGPTETTIWSTLYKIESIERVLPIGRPIANTQIYLLDAALNPVPIGVPGELYIGGAGLARAYLDRPEATAERFVPDPFGSEPGGRVYRTGDQARYLPDGNLEFLGRVDYQVKVRGFRVELGEIESVLSQHPRIRQAIVVARDAQRVPGDCHLAAYVVPNQEKPTGSELVHFLRDKLPDYMIPSAFKIVEALPLTPNGKVDRRALPAPEGLELETAFVSPRTPIEELLADLWALVLGVQRIGVHDNFFELGGHSLLATELFYRIREALQVDLPLRTLFELPTIAGLAARIAELQGKQEYAASIARWPILVPAPHERCQPFPLTDVQQAYWIGRRRDFELGNVATHIYVELESQNLDIERLELALQRLIARHDMLRAIIRPDGQQQILEQVPLYHIEVLDLCGQTPDQVTAQVQVVRQRMSHQVLPTDQWPLFEIRALQLDDQRVRLHISLDVLIGDAWSWQILSRELAQLYAGPDTRLVPLELSFRDYVLAEATLRQSELYRRSLDYWRSRIETLPPAPEMPIVTSPDALKNPRFSRRQAKLEREEWRQLRKRATKAGLTPSGVLLAAFAEVLAAWSKSPHFTLNLTRFHRLPLHPQVNQVVGDFTSLTLLEVDCSKLESFEARARRLQERLWEDLDHGYVSGVQVLRELAQAQRGTPRAVMPVVFTSTLGQTVQDGPASGLVNLVQENSSHAKVVYSITQTPQVWLDHQVSEQAGVLTYNWDAVEALFPEGLLDDMFEAYGRLLHHLIEEEAAWQEVERKLVPPVQLKWRQDINATEGPVSAELLHTLFAAQVRQRPNQAAVITPQRTLTYAQLYGCSNRVGHWLRERGAQPNQLVAVVMEKGWEQVAAVLGILQAGAAYLPVDPELPPERIEYLLSHGEVELALTQAGVDKKLQWPEPIRRLCLDGDLKGLDDHPLEPVQRPEDLAYVIYTSGSTGQPKGVMIDHRGAVNTVLDINRRLRVGPEARVLALSSLSFDLSVYDLFGMLSAGGALVIPEAARRHDPAHWTELMKREGVSLWNSVPALMELWVEYASSQGERWPESLRVVLLSGDWIPVSLPERIKGLGEGVEVFSGGGATEASIWSILYPIGQVDPRWTSIPYGRPLANQEWQVLDDGLEPRPVWVPGELYIGGVGLAKGYWRDEEKTRANFILHPRTGKRLYRTGDWGRYLPDGNIEFLGREDYQVKIRGHRIELEEIEAALLQHPGVRAGVVAAVGESRGDKRLVAYVVAEGRGVSSLRMGERAVSEDYIPSPGEGLLLDPIERLKFKLTHPGVRPESGKESGVQLAEPELDEELIQAYVARRSYRTFESGPISFEQFSRFLSCLRMVNLEGVPLPKSRYGSAGSLYPVQAYLYVKAGRVERVAEGAYYYHPLEHRLVSLLVDGHLDSRLYVAGNHMIFEGSAFAVFLVGQLDAIAPLYGEWARDLTMLEAGLMTQLLEMSAPACAIGLCQIGGLNDKLVHQWLGLGQGHVYLHSLLGGRISADQGQLPALREESEELRHLLSLLQEESAEPAGLVSANSVSIGSLPTLAAGDEGILIEDLQRFLRGKLPDYMVPSTFVFLDALPLTSNGKVDRRALPLPDVTRPEREKTYIAPETDLEQTIAAIWREVLHVDRIGVHDSFFDLGGNSVHAIQVLGKLRDVLGKDLPVLKIFEHPTLHSMAEYLAREREAPFSFEQSDDRADARRSSRRRRMQVKRQGSSNSAKGDSE